MFEATLVFLGGSADLSRWVGALKAIEESQVAYPRIVASSTASPIAALVACGYTIGEIQESWDEFKVGTEAQTIGANEIESWVRGLLDRKMVETFGDLKDKGEPELKLLVQDVNDPTALMLPDDAWKLGLQPNELQVASAVRASMAIPDVPIFAPIRLGTRQLAGCYWRRADARVTWDQIVMPRTAPLSFYSEPIVGASALVSRILFPRSRSVLRLDREISQSPLVRAVHSALSNKPTAREISREDEGILGLPGMTQFINLSSLPAWFSLNSDDVREAAIVETKRGLSDLGISLEPDVGAKKGAAPSPGEGESGVLVPPAVEESQVSEERHINAWIEDGEPPLEKGRPYRFAINVGKLCQKALAAPQLPEIDWKDKNSLKVMIVVSGYGFSVEPRQREFLLPKQGNTDPVYFAITAIQADSFLVLRISLYFARELTLLQEFEVPIAIKESEKVA